MKTFISCSVILMCLQSIIFTGADMQSYANFGKENLFSMVRDSALIYYSKALVILSLVVLLFLEYNF